MRNEKYDHIYSSRKDSLLNLIRNKYCNMSLHFDHAGLISLRIFHPNKVNIFSHGCSHNKDAYKSAILSKHSLPVFSIISSGRYHGMRGYLGCLYTHSWGDFCNICISWHFWIPHSLCKFCPDGKGSISKACTAIACRQDWGKQTYSWHSVLLEVWWFSCQFNLVLVHLWHYLQ